MFSYPCQVGVAGAAGSSIRGVLRDILWNEGNIAHLVGFGTQCNLCFELFNLFMFSYPCQVGVAGAAGSSIRGVLRDILWNEGNIAHLVGFGTQCNLCVEQFCSFLFFVSLPGGSGWCSRFVDTWRPERYIESLVEFTPCI